MKTIHFKVTITGLGDPRSIDIGKDSCIIGRGKDSDIVIDNDLISRKHLKIWQEADSIFFEEMGSSNGSWFYQAKLEKNKKTKYQQGDEIHLGKLSTGIKITIEKMNARSILERPQSNEQDNEKTMVFQLSPKALQETVIDTPTLLVANGSPVHVQVHKPIVRLVEDDSPPPPKPMNSAPKHGLEDKVKLLINQESEKLKDIALKQSNEILEKARADEKLLLINAQKDAQSIISKAKNDAKKIQADAAHTIALLEDKVRTTKVESDEMVKSFKHTAGKIESSIQSLKKEEEQFSQKIKFLEENVSAIQEKIKNEHIALEDIKTQASTVRKNADIKFEELVMEERRSRARIETEIVEAKTQTAKVYAEAEKIQASKEMMETEISQLKQDRGQIEREINELQISCRRHEYDFEKLSREYNELLEEQLAAQETFDHLQSEGKLITDKFQETKDHLEHEESLLRNQIAELQVTADHYIENAVAEAASIVEAAHAKSQEIADQSALSMRELQDHKQKFYADLDLERTAKLKAIQDEADKLKAVIAQEIKKAELKKENAINEAKWTEDNAHKKAEKIISDGKSEIEAQKALMIKDQERIRAAAELEMELQKTKLAKDLEAERLKANTDTQSFKDKIQSEILQIKRQAENEAAALKAESHNYCESAKVKADNIAVAEKFKWDQKYSLLIADQEAAAEAKKRHELAIVKTEALKDENYIAANLRIEEMIAAAHLEVEEVRKECAIIKAKEQHALLDMKKIEMERIEELRVKFDQYKIDSRNEMAEHMALAVSEYMTNDMIKSRHMPLNERLIKQFGERVKKLTTEASLGRLHPTNKPTKAFPKRDYRKLFKWTVRLCIFSTLAYLGVMAYLTYTAEFHAAFDAALKFYNEQDFKLDSNTKNQIIELLR